MMSWNTNYWALLINLALIMQKKIHTACIIKYDEVIQELTNWLDYKALLKKPTQQGITAVTISPEASIVQRSRPQFTAKKCYSRKSHSPEERFKKPGNEHKQQDNAEASLKESTIEELQASSDQMSIPSASATYTHPSASAIGTSNSSAEHASPKLTSSCILIIFALIDTMATHHMFIKHEAFTTYTDGCHEAQMLNLVGRKATLPIHSQGTLLIAPLDGSKLLLEDVLHMPGLKHTLMGGTILLHLGYITSPDGARGFKVEKDGITVFQGSLSPNDSLLHVKISIHHPLSASAISNDIALQLHHCLSHPNY
ncbi:hypothetical protein CROQUDRAFT_687537 [Cronartium quercuum f. sp. fusiforme G11]|uniref:Retrovirus-related Pol polyprotein from transposon TNT 1-94-like beta-barrel domain-containing protein n=1 Tax=Cronartium quercuum f. sp. fusiforme G11 TaxID=708437 RepID=A0A9P6TH70_9BASI|nr:hypothetical protein CROQUDRAFT_687537 [Cronartium quercuum f. sp. fusiforme G11]